MKILKTQMDYITHLRYCGLTPSHGDMVWTYPRLEGEFEIYVTDHDGCTIYFQYDEGGRFTRQITNATLEDISNVILLHKRADKI